MGRRWLSMSALYPVQRRKERRAEKLMCREKWGVDDGCPSISGSPDQSKLNFTMTRKGLPWGSGSITVVMTRLIRSDDAPAPARNGAPDLKPTSTVSQHIHNRDEHPHGNGTSYRTLLPSLSPSARVRRCNLSVTQYCRENTWSFMLGAALEDGGMYITDVPPLVARDSSEPLRRHSLGGVHLCNPPETTAVDAAN